MTVHPQPKASMPRGKHVTDPGASQGARRATEDAPGSADQEPRAGTDSEVVAHAKRRNFSPAQKRRIDRVPGSGVSLQPGGQARRA